ncbi:MAG: glycosyltransferase, partial [Mobilitalea sp.]
MKILIVMTDAVNPRDSAGGNRLMTIISSLIEHGHELSILLYKGKSKDRALCEKESGCRCFVDNGELLGYNDREFGAFLRTENYEKAILSNYFIYTYYAPSIRRYLPQCGLIFDTIDLHQVRKRREAIVKKNMLEYGYSYSVRYLEDMALSDCDLLWVVTDHDRRFVENVKGIPNNKTLVLPTFHTIYERVVPFEERKGVIFLGNYRHDPNIDAITYFIKEIYPLLKSRMPDIDVTLAGASTPEMIYRLCAKEHRVHVVGYVDDPKVLIAHHRVSIAPLRFGSGIKGKIGEYLSCGTPCVTTSVGAEGMEFAAGCE